MQRKKQTERILNAFSTGKVDIFAHPTGRKIGEREPYNIDTEKLIEAAADYGIMLEINAFPNRLDLDSLNAKKASDDGVMISIGTDAHGIAHLNYMRYGVGIARRAWLEKNDVINTYSYRKLKKYLGK
jgi:DNA polymerase (family 10)